jgi:hypothetical protein
MSKITERATMVISDTLGERVGRGKTGSGLKLNRTQVLSRLVFALEGADLDQPSAACVSLRLGLVCRREFRLAYFNFTPLRLGRLGPDSLSSSAFDLGWVRLCGFSFD